MAGQLLRSGQAGLNANASAWNAKSRLPKGKENGLSKQGNEREHVGRKGRGKARADAAGWEGEAFDRDMAVPAAFSASVLQPGSSRCAISTDERATGLPGAGLGELGKAGRCRQARPGRGGSRRARSRRGAAEITGTGAAEGQCCAAL